jgi:hypothetical protein
MVFSKMNEMFVCCDMLQCTSVILGLKTVVSTIICCIASNKRHYCSFTDFYLAFERTDVSPTGSRRRRPGLVA